MTRLRMLAASDVDFIIADWNMPYMNGIEFIRIARTIEKSRYTPVLMVTTHAATHDIVEALRAGVNSYIVKPFSVETFREKIEAICENTHHQQGRCDPTYRRAIT